MRALDLAFVLYVLAISITPLVPWRGWQGYGPAGEFYYIGPGLQLRYNDPTFGNDKPQVFVSDGGKEVSLIEVSDQNSYVNGTNIYYGFSVKTRLVNGSLYAYYSSPRLSFIKAVSPEPEGLLVRYSCNCTLYLTLTLWRWYFSDIEGYSRPVTRSLEPSNTISFSAYEAGRLYRAELRLNPRPIDVTISGALGYGLNKISLEFKAREVALEVVPLGPGNSFSFFDLRGSNYLYPLMALLTSAGYLALRRRVG